MEYLKYLSSQIFYNAGELSDAWVEIIAGSAWHTWKISHEKEGKRAESGSHFVKNKQQRRLVQVFNEHIQAFFYVMVVRDRRVKEVLPLRFT